VVGELLDWGCGESRGWIEEAEFTEEERSRQCGGGEEMTAGGGEEERPGPTPVMWAHCHVIENHYQNQRGTKNERYR
jgi:hypothetical protein